MKKIIVLSMFCLAILLSGCKKEGKDLFALIIGEWELVQYEPSVKSITIGDEKIEVSISFAKENNSFVLFQNIGTGYMKTYSGTWSLSGSVLSGKYSDGASWANTYTIDIEDDTLIMVSTAETFYYKRR